jgi:membrane protein DedA with SNARE-associated domain
MEMWSDFIIKYGYFGVFILLVIGIVALPIPDEVLLAFVGYHVYLEKMNYSTALLVAFSGAMVGITISYFLGLKLGLPFLRKFGPRMMITEDKISWTTRLFEKWGPFLLFIGYFIPGVRHVTAYLAGISAFSIRKFSLFAYSGALFWVFFYITLGLQLGRRWYIVAQFLENNGRIMLMLLLALCIIVLFIWRKLAIKISK